MQMVSLVIEESHIKRQSFIIQNQKQLAEESKKALEESKKFSKPIVTEI
jgi:peptide methionine sulfoxide reductase MsrA